MRKIESNQYFLIHFLLLLFVSNLVYAVDSEVYSFDPLKHSRDPFIPPEGLIEEISDKLLFYDLNQINLVAILTGSGPSKAMFSLPNGETHIVQKGDAIGKYGGVIEEISTSEVVVVESFNLGGKIKKNRTNLILAP